MPLSKNQRRVTCALTLIALAAAAPAGAQQPPEPNPPAAPPPVAAPPIAAPGQPVPEQPAAEPPPPPNPLITPSISLQERATDNSRLEHRGRSDLVTTISPAVSVRDSGARVNLNLDYTFNYDIYANNTFPNTVRNELAAGATAEVIRNFAFIDLNGAITQEPISRTTPLTIENRNLARQNTISTFDISPYFRNHLGDFADSEVRYRYGRVFYDTPINQARTATLNNSSISDASALLTSGNRFSTLQWQLQGDIATTQQSGDPNFDNRSVLATGEYALSRYVALLLVGGYDDVESGLLTTKLTGPYYGAGFQLTPGPNTRIRAVVGERYNRPNYTAQITWRFAPQSNLFASLVDGVATESGEILDRLDTLGVDANGLLVSNRTGLPFTVRDLAAQQLGSEIFRDRTATVTLSTTQARTTISGTTYFTRRVAVSRPVAGELFGGNQSTVGVSASVGRQINPALTATLTLAYADARNDGDTRSTVPPTTTFQGIASVSYAFNNSLSGSLSYSYLNQNSSQGGSTVFNQGNVQENAITVVLRKVF